MKIMQCEYVDMTTLSFKCTRPKKMAAAIWKVKRQTFSKTKSTIKNNFIQGRFEAGFLRIFVPRSRPCFIMRYQPSPVKIVVHYISDIFCHHLRHILNILLGSLLLPTTTRGRPARPSSWPRGQERLTAWSCTHCCRPPGFEYLSLVVSSDVRGTSGQLWLDDKLRSY